MTNDQIKTEPTPAGLKIYYPIGDGMWGHIKTVKCKYEPIIKDLSWIKDYKKIRATDEEEKFLEEEWIHSEMSRCLQSIKWPNSATKELVLKQEIASFAKIEPREDDPYYIVIMSEGLEVRCPVVLYNLAVKLGMQIPIIKRLQ